MGSAEGGSMLNAVGYGERCPLSRVCGSDVSSPGGVWGRAPDENGFWRILKATERSFLYLYDKNLRGQFALASPLLQILGGLVPRVPFVIYAHAHCYSSTQSLSMMHQQSDRLNQ